VLLLLAAHRKTFVFFVTVSSTSISGKHNVRRFIGVISFRFPLFFLGEFCNKALICLSTIAVNFDLRESQGTSVNGGTPHNYGNFLVVTGNYFISFVLNNILFETVLIETKFFFVVVVVLMFGVWC
jgi:hypothetical protein